MITKELYQVSKSIYRYNFLHANENDILTDRDGCVNCGHIPRKENNKLCEHCFSIWYNFYNDESAGKFENIFDIASKAEDFNDFKKKVMLLKLDQ